MTIYNAIAKGFNPGRGAVDAAMIRGERQAQNQELEALKQQAAMEHGAMAREAIMGARTKEQAAYLYEQFADEAVQFGFVTPEERAQMQFDPRAFANAPTPTKRSLVKVVGPDGNPMWATQEDAAGMQAWTQVKTDPIDEELRRRKELPETPLERTQRQKAEEDLRKAKAQADAAELKTQEAQDARTEQQATKQQIIDLASSLLEKDEEGNYQLKQGKWWEGDITNVYGVADQWSLDILPGTRSAAADVDQLIKLLTLGNLKKMSGVLSDTDIGILEGAATQLQKKNLPERKLLEELKKIAQIAEKLEAEDLVDKWAPKKND